jgi:hypothetical protein
MSYYKKKQEEAINLRKFTKEFTFSDGTKSIWKYNLDKYPNGPYEVEQIYPKDYQTVEQKIKKENKKVSKYDQKFINPVNGRLISYYRAKSLGITK